MHRKDVKQDVIAVVIIYKFVRLFLKKKSSEEMFPVHGRCSEGNKSAGITQCFPCMKLKESVKHWKNVLKISSYQNCF